MTLDQWLAHIQRQHPKSIDMGLERVREVSGRMALQRPGRQVITVAGTNGKGSTVAFIDTIAREAGWRVGSYTSPHLRRYNERVRIDGASASDEQLLAAFEVIAAAAAPGGGRSAVPLTYFEYGTLAALWLFEHADLDLAVLEVGLGGRLDATNIVDPDVAVITTVDLDHQDYLGDDREAIGFEKAGIARSWKPLVLGDDDPPSSVLGHAYRIGASTIRMGCDFFAEPIDDQRWRWREVGYEVELPLPGLAAPVQVRNAAVAIAALRALETPPDDTAFAHGVADARLPGRLQRFERDGVEIVVDVGHNPQAARQLADWLEKFPATGQTLAIYAALLDKDVAGVVSALSGAVSQWHLAGLPEESPRGGDVDLFATRLQDTEAGAGIRHNTVERALAAVRALARPGDRVLVFGSFHTAGEALDVLEGESVDGDGMDR